MKIDKTAVVPQVIFNETLAVNFLQFNLLAELNLIDKLASNKFCCHIRFFEEKIVYPKINFYQHNKNFSLKNENNNFVCNFINLENNDCIYCLSNKKQLKRVKFFCNFRNSYDDETNQILEFCESNGLFLEIFDCENLRNFDNFSSSKSQKNEESMLDYYLKNSKSFEEKILLIDDQLIEIDDFIDNFEFIDVSKNKVFEECFICKRKIFLNSIDVKNKVPIKINNKLNKCQLCIDKRKRNLNSLTLDYNNNNKIFKDGHLEIFKNKFNNKEKNCDRYNFIEKLKIKEFFMENPDKYFFKNEEKSLELSNENFKSLDDRNRNNIDNDESTYAKSSENEFSFLDF